MKRKIHLIHPFFFSILPAVFLWGRNFGEVPLREVWPALLFSSLLGEVIWIFWKIIFNDLEKRAIIASLSLSVILLFNYIYNIFFDNSFVQLRFRWAFLALLAFFFIFLYLLKKSVGNFSQINKVISIASGVFLLISLSQITAGYYRLYADNRVGENEITNVEKERNKELRDIYYIILDGYSSPDVIKNVLGFEQVDDFIGYLEGNGFYIARESESNYPATLLSLPSSLNMSYLEDPQDDREHFYLAENHAVKDILNSYGYRYIHFGADAFTYFNRYADKNINIGFFTPYQSLLWHNTVFKPLQDITGARLEGFAEKLGFLDTRKTQWEREKYKLGELSRISGEEGPTFVFAHFLLPKGINVFDEDGSYIAEEEAKRNGSIDGYLNQVAYINTRMKEVLDNILGKSDREPIIIIQGDHGFPFYDNLDKLEEFKDPAQAEALAVPGGYSFPILNAYYFPDGGSTSLYQSISPVNSFRVLFNYYFGQEFDILEDITYTAGPNDESFVVWDK